MANEIDGVSDVRVFEGIRPAVYAATGNGQIVDLAGYESPVFVLATGDWTDGAYTVTFEHSDASDMTGAVAVPAADLLGDTIPTLDAVGDENKVYRVGYRGSKRYVRAVITETGAGTTGIALAGAWVLSNVRHLNRA
jgi:hypothetical protein